jgi:hypothetical protein
MRNVSDKSCRENQNTHFMLNKYFSENFSVCKIMLKSILRARQATDDKIIRRVRFACWITKNTDTLSKYIILIVFPRQSGYANAPQYYVIPTLSVLFIICLYKNISIDQKLM